MEKLVTFFQPVSANVLLRVVAVRRKNRMEQYERITKLVVRPLVIRRPNKITVL